MEQLDNATLTKVFEALPLRERARCTSVCQAWKKLLSEPYLWRKLKADDDETLTLAAKKAKKMGASVRLLGVGNNPKRPRTWPHPEAVLAALRMLGRVEELRAPSVCFEGGELTEVADHVRIASVGGSGWDEHIPEILSAPAAPLRITTLDLHGDSIGAEGAGRLAKALTSNKSLAELDLWGNDIRDEGAGSLAVALTRNRTLTKLDLSFNGIGADGASKLAASLPRNKTLVRLNLLNNNIEDEGAGRLAEALACNTTLASLDLRGNVLGVRTRCALLPKRVSTRCLVKV